MAPDGRFPMKAIYYELSAQLVLQLSGEKTAWPCSLLHPPCVLWRSGNVRGDVFCKNVTPILHSLQLFLETQFLF